MKNAILAGVHSTLAQILGRVGHLVVRMAWVLALVLTNSEAATAQTPPAAPVITSFPPLVRTQTALIEGTSDPSVKIHVYVFSNLYAIVTADAAGFWSTTLPNSTLSEGANIITAQAYPVGQPSNLSAPSNAVTVVKDTTRPAAPALDQSTFNINSGDVVISGSGEPYATVRLNSGATLIESVTLGADGLFTFTLPFSSFSEGSNSRLVTQTDVAGNSGTSAFVTVIVDTVAPSAPSLTAFSGVYGPNRAPQLQMNVTQVTGITFHVFVDGTEVYEFTGANSIPVRHFLPVALFSEGTFEVAVRLSDLAGNLSGLSNTQSLVFDGTPPPVPTLSVNRTITNSSSFATIQTEPDTASIQIVDENGTVRGGASGTGTVQLSLSTPTYLIEGENRLRARALDSLGNASTPGNEVVITLDTVRPATPVLTTQSGTYDATPPAIEGTIEPGANAEVLVNGLLFELVASDPVAGDFTADVPANHFYAETNTVTVRAFDAAGNASSQAASITLTDTSTTPLAPPVIVSGSDAVGRFASGQIVVEAPYLTVLNLYVNGVFIYEEVNLDQGQTTLYIDSSVLEPGENTITFTASLVSQFRESAPSNAHVMLLDLDPPTLEVIAPQGVTNDPTFNLQTEAGAFVEVYDAFGNYIETVEMIGTSQSYTVPLGFVAEGPNLFWFFAYDLQGNNDFEGVSASVTLDLTAPPTPQIDTPPEVFGTTAPALIGTAEADAAVTIFLNGIEAGTTTADAGGGWTLTLLSDAFVEGPNSLTATATDAATNQSAPSAAVVLTKDTIPPAAPVISTGDQLLIANSTPLVEGTAEGGSALTLFVNGSSVVELDVPASGLWSFALPLADLAEGPNTITASILDSLGNESPLSAALILTLDTIAPEPPIVSASALRFANDPPVLSGVTEALATIILVSGPETDPVAVADESGNWSYTPDISYFEANAPSGTQFTFFLRDLAGNLSAAGAEVVIFRDTLAPVTPSITTQPYLFSAGPQTVAGSSEAGATVTVLVNGLASGTTMASPDWSYTIPETDLTEGANLITAFATDDVGNVGTSDTDNSVVLTKDSIAPDAPVITTAGGTVGPLGRPRIEGTAEPGAAVLLSINGTPFATYTAQQDGTWFVIVDVSDLTEGPNSLTAVAVDPAGNESAQSAVLSLTRDTAAPTPPTLVASATLISNEPPVLSGTAEPGSAVLIYAGGGAFWTVTADADGAWTLTLGIDEFDEGDNVFYAISGDAAGNISLPSPDLTVTRDSTAPAAPVIATVAQVFGTDAPPLSGTAEAGSTITVFLGGAAAGTTTADANGNWTFLLTPDAFVEGPNTVTTASTDAAGNSGPGSAPVVLTKDTTAPQAPVIGGVTGGQEDPVLSLTGTAEPGAVIRVTVNGTAQPEVTADASGAWSLDLPNAAFTAEQNTLVAVAVDALGNLSPASAALVVTFDKTAPSLTLTGPNGTQVGPFTLTATFSEPVAGFDLADIGVTNATLSALTGGPAVYTVTLTPDLGQTVTVSVAAGAAEDEVGNLSLASGSLSFATSDVGGALAEAEDAVREIVLTQTTQQMRSSVGANRQMSRAARDRLAAGDGAAKVRLDQPMDVDGTAEYSNGTLSTRGTFFGLRHGIAEGSRRLTFGSFDITADDQGSQSIYATGRIAWERDLGDHALWGYFIGGELRRTTVDADLTGTIGSTGANLGAYLAAELSPGLFFDGAIAAGLSQNRLALTDGTTDISSTYLSQSYAISGAFSGRITRGNVEFWPELSFALARTDIGSIDLTGRNDALNEAVLTADMGAVTLTQLSFAPEIRIGLDGQAPGQAEQRLTLRPDLTCEKSFGSTRPAKIAAMALGSNIRSIAPAPGEPCR